MSGVSAILFLILNVLLYLFLTLAVLLVLILLLPVQVRFRAQPDIALSDDWEPSGPLPWQADISWGWVLLRLALAGDRARLGDLRIELAGIRVGAKSGKGRSGGEPARKVRSQARPARKARPKQRFRRRLGAALIRDLLREGRRTLARVWRLLGLRVSGEISFGFPDPALTGITLGIFHAALKPRDLRLNPEFLDPCVRGRLEGEARFVLVQGLAALVALAFTRPVRKLWIPSLRWFRTSESEVEQHVHSRVDS